MVNIMFIVLALIIGFLLISLTVKDVFYQKERKDLLNRIMSKDLNDYKNVGNTSLPKGNNKLKERALEEEFGPFYK